MFTRRRDAPHEHLGPNQPAPFSPVSRFEGFLLPLSLRLSLSLLRAAQLSPHLVILQHFPYP